MGYFVSSFLAKRGVKEEIQTFDARKISPDIRKNVEELLRKNKDSFDSKASINFMSTAKILINYRGLALRISETKFYKDNDYQHFSPYIGYKPQICDVLWLYKN